MLNLLKKGVRPAITVTLLAGAGAMLFSVKSKKTTYEETRERKSIWGETRERKVTCEESKELGFNANSKARKEDTKMNEVAETKPCSNK